MLRATNLIQLFPFLPDPKDPRGVRHRLDVVLALAMAAVVGGAQAVAAIWEFAQDVGTVLLEAVGLPASIPSEPTIRRLIEAVDPEPVLLLRSAGVAR